MDYLLGVDGGGTKTVIAAADLEGKIIIEKTTGSINFKSIGIEGAAKNFISGMDSVIKELEVKGARPYFSSSYFGIAGLNTSYDKDVFEKIILNDVISPYLNLKKAVLCNDTVIGLAAGSLNKNRVIIICGTGSNCYGVNEEGNEAKANGWDYILGDEGSGTSMGIKTLRAVMQAYDGRGSVTLLTGKIFNFLDIRNIDELNRWAYSGAFPKDRIASLSLPLCEAAETGDRVAIRILREEAGEVIKNISAVARRLNLENREFDLVFVGNNFKCIRHFKNIISKRLKKLFIGINLIPLTGKPAAGAVRLALNNLNA